MNEPVKCPDCGTWWRGDEHRCPPRATGGPIRPLPYAGGGGGAGGVYAVGERGPEVFTTNVPLANVRLHEVKP